MQGVAKEVVAADARPTVDMAARPMAEMIAGKETNVVFIVVLKKSVCSIKAIPLTPRFNAVNHERTRLKPGVNEKFFTKQSWFNWFGLFLEFISP
jgi:hypothetical protein